VIDTAFPKAPPQTIRRAADVLRLLSYHGRLSAREVARYLEEDKSTVQRAMQALEVSGLVARDEDGAWSPNTALLELASRGAWSQRLVRSAAPFLGALYQRSKLAVRLCIPQGVYMVHIHRLPSRADALPRGYAGMVKGVGYRVAMDSSAVGIAYLAALPEAERRQLYRSSELGTRQANPSKLAADLEACVVDTLARGFALTDERFRSGTGGIAAAILDTHHHPLAAVGVVGPRDAIVGPRTDTLGQWVKTVAEDIGFMMS